MRWKNSYFIIIVGLVISGILYPVFNSEGKRNPDIKIDEAAFFDPLCKDKQIFLFDYSANCVPTSNWSVSMGSSTNIDDLSAENVNHAKILFLRIPLSKIKSSSPFNELAVTDAKITLRTAEDVWNKEGYDNKFAVYNGYCSDASWTNDTPIAKLPCLRESKNFDAKQDNFSEYKKASELTTVTIDIKNHVNLALEEKMNSFTELIEFYPEQFKTTDFNADQRMCLYNEAKNTDMNTCVGMNRIGVYSVGHPTEGLRPQISIMYEEYPSTFGKILNSAVTFLPAIIGIISFIGFSKVSSFHPINQKVYEKIVRDNMEEIEANKKKTERLRRRMMEHPDEQLREKVKQKIDEFESRKKVLLDEIIRLKKDLGEEKKNEE